MGKQEADRAKALVRERIAAARGAMDDCSEAIDRELGTLAARGIVPTCSKGCSHCCRQEILVTRAEAEAIVEWVQASWPAEQIDALKERTRAWLVWYRTDYPRLVASGVTRLVAMYE